MVIGLCVRKEVESTRSSGRIQSLLMLHQISVFFPTQPGKFMGCNQNGAWATHELLTNSSMSSQLFCYRTVIVDWCHPISTEIYINHHHGCVMLSRNWAPGPGWARVWWWIAGTGPPTTSCPGLTQCRFATRPCDAGRLVGWRLVDVLAQLGPRAIVLPTGAPGMFTKKLMPPAFACHAMSCLGPMWNHIATTAARWYPYPLKQVTVGCRSCDTTTGPILAERPTGRCAVHRSWNRFAVEKWTSSRRKIIWKLIL